MRDFEEKGYANSADETAKVIAAYHDLVKKKQKQLQCRLQRRFSEN